MAREMEAAPGLARAAPEPTVGQQAPAGALVAPGAARSLWRDAARRLARDKGAMAGMIVVVLLVAVAIAAPHITPYPPNDQSFRIKLKPPSAAHWFGTDEFGRDIFSRVLVGTRVALWVGTVPVAVALVVGVAAGLIAGYYGGAIDSITMRVIDVILAFPWLLLAIGIMAILGPGINNVVIAVAIVYIPSFARIVRGSVLSIKEKEYVEAARAAGLPAPRI
ncbi:MAG TPA: ABC transporter permease, partial [Thermomicrobiales bacterium]|nr:ABC transporter permease [Thermomicrobiales bacterium]